MNMAVNFTELLLKDPEKYQRIMRGEILNCLENVKTISSSFSEKLLEGGINFDFERLERVLAACKIDSSKQDREDAMHILKMYTSTAVDKYPQEKSGNRED